MKSLIVRTLALSLLVWALMIPTHALAESSTEPVTEQSPDPDVAQMEQELMDQGLIDDPEPAEEDPDQPSFKDGATSEESLMFQEGAIGTDGAAAMMSIPSVNLGESIFSSATHIIAPDVSMKLGAARMDYPIAVPPGRNGATPGVGLSYSSSAKNGLAGVGWNINTNIISRDTRNGLCYTCTDFLYNGERLVPENVDGDGYGTYKAEKEAAFIIFEYLSDNTWQVTFKDGSQYVYGTSAFAKKSNTNGTFAWYLSSITDTNGNAIDYTYTLDQGEVYSHTITYAGYYTVSFFYENRTDVISSYLTNSLITTDKRLKTITVQGGTTPIRAYDFTYNYSANTQRSILKTITHYGSDFILDVDNAVSSGTALPATQLTNNQDLTAFTASPSAIADLTKGQGYTDSYDYPVITGDWNGDGRKDVARALDNSIQFYIANGSGFDTYNELSDLSKNDGYANASTHPILTGDWNADGRTDVARVGASSVVCFISTDAGWQPYTGINDFGTNTYANSNEWPVFSGDFNGDGKSDIGRVLNNVVRVYTSTGTGFTQMTDLSGIGKTVLANSNDYPLVNGDYNGDGKTDIARVTTTDIKVYNSNGSSFTHTMTLYNFSPQQGVDNNDNYPILTGDWNGDGKTDIGRVNARGVQCYVSTGSGFTQFTGITGGIGRDQGYTTYDAYPITTGDFNDDGLTDIARVIADSVLVYTSTGTGFTSYSSVGAFGKNSFANNNEYPLITGNFSGKGKTSIARFGDNSIQFYTPTGNGSDLVTQVVSTSGSITDITYTPSSDYTNTLLPFVLQTVSAITVDDGLGNASTTNYAFSGGLYDYTEKELRSFEKAVTTLPDGTRTETTYHQSQFLDGCAYLTEHRAADDTLLSKTDQTWAADAIVGVDAAFVNLTQSVETTYDNGQSVFLTTDYTYDSEHGGLLEKKVYGTDIMENDAIINAYTYGYFNLFQDSYPVRTTQERLESGGQIFRQINYDYYTRTGNLKDQIAVNGTLGGNDDPKTQYIYDTYGNVTTIIDPNGYSTNFHYDTTINTHVVQVTLPRTGAYTHIRQATIDLAFGKPDTVTDENNQVTVFGFDDFGRVSSVSKPDYGSETYIYDDVSMPRSLTKQVAGIGPEVIETLTYTDGFGRTVQTVEKGETDYMVSLVTYDELGRQACAKGPFFSGVNTFLAEHGAISADPSSVNNNTQATWVRNHYDDKGRVVHLEQSGDIHTYMAYENLRTRVTDPDGHQKTQINDILGRTLQVIEHGITDQITNYEYTIAGDLTTVSRLSPSGTTITNSIDYNTLGQKTAMVDPDMGTWTYTYDFNGNLVTQTDAGGVTISFEYDGLNRQTRKTYSTDPGKEALFEYDAGTNGIGYLYKKSNENAETTYAAYDAMGRVLSETRTVDTTSVVFDYTYDPAGRPESKTITQNSVVFKKLNYVFYPTTSLLHQVSDIGNTYTTISNYSPQGKIGDLNHGNDTITNYMYEASTGRITQIYSFNMSQAIVDKAYTYSKAGDVIQVDNIRTGVVYNYHYDHLHRLISEQTDGVNAVMGTTVEIIEFTYDEANGPVHAPSETLHNGSSTTYTYTETGNRMTKTAGIEFTSYETNADNMISRIIVDGVETTFAYDADNRRVKKTQGFDVTRYYGEDFEIIKGDATLYVFAGNLRIAKVTGTEDVYFHKDHLNSTEGLSMSDGTIIDTGEYLPYGGDRNINALLQTSSYKFTDQEQDDGTGLYNYDARLYDPVIGQFVMADAIVPEPYNPQSLNRYAYVLNNPIRYVDPTGHFADNEGMRDIEYGSNSRDWDNYEPSHDNNDKPTIETPLVIIKEEEVVKNAFGNVVTVKTTFTTIMTGGSICITEIDAFGNHSISGDFNAIYETLTGEFFRGLSIAVPAIIYSIKTSAINTAKAMVNAYSLSFKQDRTITAADMKYTYGGLPDDAQKLGEEMNRRALGVEKQRERRNERRRKEFEKIKKTRNYNVRFL